jgi:flagellin
MIQINTSFLFERQQNAQELSNRKNAQKLASAKRINHSADDAAGLSISTNMTTHIKNMDTVKRGLGQGLDYTKVAMGALNEMTDMLQRIRELGIQSMNDTYNDEQRAQIDTEYQQLTKEIDHIAQTTEYNGTFPFIQPPPAPIGSTSSLPDVMPSDLFSWGSSGIKPFAYIPAGATNVTISIDSYSMDDDLELFARNGDHIWGTGLTDIVSTNQVVNGININASVITATNGFGSKMS